MIIERLLKYIRHQYINPRWSKWLNRRIPAANKIRLNQRRLFIFPTKAGFGFLLLILLLWVLGTNYENNIIIAITFFLISLFITGIIHSFANLSGLIVSFVGAEPVYCGRQAQFEISLRQNGKKHRQSIWLNFKGFDAEELHLLGTQEDRTLLSKRVNTRGWCHSGRVTLQSTYPLGFFRVWTHLDLGSKVLVYPRPIYEQPLQKSKGEGSDGLLQLTTGSDDFIGLKSYVAGQPLQHVAWKHYARERGLYVKQYGDSVDERLWVDWEIYPNYDRETRLSRLCGLLLEISSDDSEYGLKLPTIKIEMGKGDSHKKLILKELALFEASKTNGHN